MALASEACGVVGEGCATYMVRSAGGEVDVDTEEEEDWVVVLLDSAAVTSGREDCVSLGDAVSETAELSTVDVSVLVRVLCTLLLVVRSSSAASMFCVASESDFAFCEALSPFASSAIQNCPDTNPTHVPSASDFCGSTARIENGRLLLP